MSLWLLTRVAQIVTTAHRDVIFSEYSRHIAGGRNSPSEIINSPSPEIWQHEKFGHLILMKIIEIVATRCQILRLKFTKFDFGWGSAPNPTGELTTLARPPSCI